MTKTKRRRKHAVIIPPEEDDSFVYCNGEEDYYWDPAPSIEGEMYIDAEKGELYPGRVVIVKPTQRWVRGTDLSRGDGRPKYWEIVK